MDTVFIEQLALETRIGVHAWEHALRRPLVLDLALGCDLREAAATDHIRDAVDYKAVCDCLWHIAENEQFQLLETFAETAARRLFSQFPIQHLTMTVGKPGAVAHARTVGVRLERRREDYVGCGI